MPAFHPNVFLMCFGVFLSGDGAIRECQLFSLAL
jgi:hypothetical protein